MGGSVDVISQEGTGSTFWIDLPIESDDTFVNTTGHDNQSINAIETAHTSHNTILYIEDNPSNIKLISQILGKRQHIHLLTAHTPELGLELAMSRHPDLIMLDINMPGMSGYQLLEILKSHNELKSVPVLAITANAMPSDIERGKKAGFIDYVTKPIDIAKFLTLFDNHLADINKRK